MTIYLTSGKEAPVRAYGSASPNNAAYRSINGVETLAASAHLRRLRDLELLEMKGSGNRTYYIPGWQFHAASEAIADRNAHAHSNADHQIVPDLHQVGVDLHQVGTDLHQAPEVLSTLPSELQGRIRSAGLRPRQEVLRPLVRALCAHTPRSARELAEFLGGRDPKNLVRLHLHPMLEKGELAYTIPEMPHHPDQKYTVPWDEPPMKDA